MVDRHELKRRLKPLSRAGTRATTWLDAAGAWTVERLQGLSASTKRLGAPLITAASRDQVRNGPATNGQAPKRPKKSRLNGFLKRPLFGKAKDKSPAPEQRPENNAAGAAAPVSAPAEKVEVVANEWLAAHGLEKSYGGQKVVGGVSLGVRRGEVVGLLGPNGAGKTTTFYMITGLVVADAGAIELDGFDITHLPMYRRARLGIGYLPQESSIFRGMSVADNIMSVLEIVEPKARKRKARLQALLEEFGIERVRNSPAIALSGGERRRVEIARALASEPQFMLLDEPFAGIDPIAVNDIRTLVRQLSERGIGVLITDHNVRETLSLIDRAYIIHGGEVLMEGDAGSIVANDSVREHYLGRDFHL